MKLEALDPGRPFMVTGTGRPALLIYKGNSGAVIDYRNPPATRSFFDKKSQTQVTFTAPDDRRTVISLGTEVTPL